MKYLKKTIEYGLYALVFLLPLGTRLILKSGFINGGYSEYGTISLYGTDGLLVVILILNLVVVLKNKITNYELRIKNYWYTIALLEFFVLISIVFAPDKLLGLYGYFKFLLSIGLFWLVSSVDYKKIKLIYWFLAGIFFQASFGIWQFLTQSSFANKWLGLAEHDPLVAGTSVVETLSGARFLRAYGGLDHPNVLGGVLVISILMILFLIINGKNKKRELPITNCKNTVTSFQKKYTPPIPLQRGLNTPRLSGTPLKRGIIYYLLFTVYSIALFFTFSRGAWAGLLVGVIAFLVIAVIKKDLIVQKEILKYVLIFACVIFLLFNQYSDLVLTRLSQDTRLEIKSNTERIDSLQEAKKIIINHWFFGAGVGNYSLALKNEIDSSREAWNYQPVHNTFLLFGAEIGLFGSLCISGIFVYIFYLLIQKRGERAVYLASILISMGIMFMVDHWWWSLHFGILFMWLILGLIARELCSN